MPFTIPDTELSFRTSRAGGPGGQHVNKTSTRVEVVWDVAESGSLADDERERLCQQLASRIDTKGRLRVVSDRYRSQLRNREDAVARLHALVRGALKVPKRRKKTRPSKAAVEQRLQEKRARSDQKRQRRPVQDDE